MSEKNKHKYSCSVSSVESYEDMFGTAPRVETWFLLEYSGHWSGAAFKDSKIPKKVKKRIKRHLKTYKNSRLQLIKQQKSSEDGIKFFVALSAESLPRIYELTLESYEDLLELDIESLLEGDANLRKDPLFLLCTNGEYDTCCGKFGKPVYLEVAGGAHGPDTWQTIHIGGHRFAPTFICFPHGLYYGRVTKGSRAEELIDEYREGRVDIRNYRGRTCYDPHVQAGEYFLRKETGEYGLSSYTLKKTAPPDKKSKIRFISESEGIVYKVKIKKDKGPVKIIKNCGDKGSSISTYRLIDLSSV